MEYYSIESLFTLLYRCEACKGRPLCISGQEEHDSLFRVEQQQIKPVQEVLHCDDCAVVSCPKYICRKMYPGVTTLKEYKHPLCPREELENILQTSLALWSAEESVPDNKLDIIEFIERHRTQWRYSVNNVINSLRTEVRTRVFVVIDYTLLKRHANDPNRHVPNFEDICREIGEAYSRNDSLRPWISSIQYSVLVGRDIPDCVGNEGSPTDMEGISEEKQAIPRHNGGRHLVWTVKVDKDKFKQAFQKGFREFDTLVEQLESREWSKIELCRLAYLLLSSGHVVTDYKKYRPWTSFMLESLGIPPQSRTLKSLDPARYAFYNIKDEDEKQNSIKFFRNNYNYLLGGEYGKQKRTEFGIPDESVADSVDKA